MQTSCCACFNIFPGTPAHKNLTRIPGLTPHIGADNSFSISALEQGADYHFTMFGGDYGSTNFDVPETATQTGRAQLPFPIVVKLAKLMIAGQVLDAEGKTAWER